MLKKERAAALGDPVRGATTPFVASFDTAVLPPEPSPDLASASTTTPSPPGDSLAKDAPGVQGEAHSHLNFYLSRDELTRGVGRSQWLSSPLTSHEPHRPGGAEELQKSSINDEISSLFGSAEGNQGSPGWPQANLTLDELTSDLTPEERQKIREEEHRTAQEALRRISNLSLGSSKDRLRVNKQRCIDEFGRHNTDKTLPSKPVSTATTGKEEPKDVRVGVDTGSSEVQIAILTAKIRAVADFLETRGTTDKVNKRNLRLLVHRRAKLLKYLRRKERGGPRWQNLIEKLGLTEGTWKGEISL